MMKLSVAFSHVHLYVDNVQDVAEYKQLEHQLNELATCVKKTDPDNHKGIPIKNLATKRDEWQSIIVHKQPPEQGAANGIGKPTEPPATYHHHEPFVSQGRDFVKQLMAGFGFRVTGCRTNEHGENTRTVLLTSSDPRGSQVVVSALDDPELSSSDSSSAKDSMNHFEAGKD
jgi:hypothetical protein